VHWLGLTLVSAVCLGLYDVSKKAALRGNPVLSVLLISTLRGWFAALGAGARSRIWRLAAIQARTAERRATCLVVAKSVIVTASWVCTFLAIKHLPLSLATPIRATAPLFTVLGALLVFGERPVGLQWLGIAVVLAAYLAFSAIGRAEGIAFTSDRWVGFLFLGTLIGSASGLYDKYLLQQLALPPFTLQFWFTLYGAVFRRPWCSASRRWRFDGKARVPLVDRLDRLVCWWLPTSSTFRPWPATEHSSRWSRSCDAATSW
jgi:drug/metabolite transporter (DMT)-like permease